jgi:hypothetical protein
MSDDPTQQGEDPTEDQVIDLTNMTEAQLREHHAALSAQIDELSSGDLTPAIAAQVNDLRVERNEVVQAVNTLATFAPVESAELAPLTAPTEEATEVVAEDTTTTPTTPAEETTVSDTPTPPADGSDAIVDAAAAIVEGAAPEMAAVAASAGGRPTEPATPAKPRVAYVAGAGQRAFTQGVELGWDSMARAWDSPAQHQAGSRRLAGQGRRGLAARLRGHRRPDRRDALGREHGPDQRPADRRVGRCVAGEAFRRRAVRPTSPPSASRWTSSARSRSAVRPTRRSRTCSRSVRSAASASPSPGASAAADTNGAITLIDIDDFEAALDEDDTATWKPCIPINCATPVTVTAEELVTCVTVQTSTEMSSPERVQEFMHKLRVQRARRREQIQLTRWDATASGYNFSGQNGVGAVPTFVEAVETLTPQLAYVERLDETDWEVVIEPGYLNKLTIDLHMVCNPVELAAARADTLAMLRTPHRSPHHGAAGLQGVQPLPDPAQRRCRGRPRRPAPPPTGSVWCPPRRTSTAPPVRRPRVGRSTPSWCG